MSNSKKFVVKNGLQSQNIDFVSPNESNTITISMLDSDTLSISGNSGQLFSITDSQSGTIFAVNDISGVPAIEVFDTGKIQIAETFGNVLLGSSTDNGSKLQVTGNISVTGTVDGRDLSVDGTKLDGIASGAEVNQNAFSNIAVSGQTTVAADAKTDTLTLVAGTNVTITTDAATDSITISANDTSVDWSEIQNKPDPVITLAGDLTGSVTLTDLGSATLTATIAANSVALGTDTTGDYVAGVTAGSYTLVTGTAGEGWSPTIAVDATSANTASKVVARDASGNFSAGTITAALSGNASTATTLQTARTINGVSFNGSANISINTVNSLTFNNGGAGAASDTTFNGGAAQTISYNTVGAPSTTGANASGTWGINITGNAATVSSITSGQVTGALGYTPYNSSNPSGYITSGASISGTSYGLATTGYGNGSQTFNQQSTSFAGYTGGWASYLISNHGDGATYYNQTIIMPFWSAPQYSRLEGGVAKGPYTFITTENQTSYSPTLTGSGASGTWGISITGSAATLTTGRTIGMTGDVTWTSGSFNGSANVTGTATLANSGVTAGTYKSVTVDAKGRVTAGTNPTTLAGYGITDAVSTASRGVANGVATLDASGLVPTTQLPSYIDDVLEYANLAGFPATGEAGKIYVALDTNKTYRWSGSAYVYITSGAVDSVAGKTGVVTLVKADVGLGNVDNTSDANKPVSTAQQTALNLKANLASPAFTGTPTTPTASAGTNTTQIASTEFVASAIAAATGKLLNVRVFTTAANGTTYTPTAGTTSVVIEAVGAGGGGGGALVTSASQYSYGTGGDCGKYGKSRFTSGFSGVTLTIGSGGTGVSGGTGNSGGSTSFGSLLVCPGGGGGICINQVGTSQLSFYGSQPSTAAVTGANIMSHNGFAGFGGRSNGGFNTSSDAGCSSYLGNGGQAVSLGNAGANATGYGGGGGGACNNVSNAARAGGNGGDGVIIVYEYA